MIFIPMQWKKKRMGFVYSQPRWQYPQHCTHTAETLLFALPVLEEVTRILMNNLQTYNTKVMKTDNAIYFALMSLRQW